MPAVTIDSAAARDRWTALPLLALIGSAGLPLNYELVPSRPMLVADVAEMTFAAASSASTFSSAINLLLLGLMYGAAGLMLARRPHAGGAVLRPLWPLWALLLLLSASVLWTFNQEKVLLNVVHNLGVVLVTLAAALHYRHAPWRLPVEFGYVLGANMALQVAAVLLLPSYAIDWQARWQGLTVHPNTLGALAFTTFWANAAALAGTVRPARPRLHLIGCALAVAAMLGADSVTSKLASLAALLLLLLFATLRRRGAGRRFYFGLLALGAICALLFLALRNTIDLSWLFDLLGRDSQLTGRSNVWDDAFKAIGMRPLLGWGFDDHAYLIATEGMPYSSYHSGVLDLAVNGGITAVVLLALLVWRWAACLLQAGRIGPHTAAFSAAFVLSYMLHNVTEASYLSPRGQMWVIFLTLLFLGACRRPHSAMAAQAVPAMQHAPA